MLSTAGGAAGLLLAVLAVPVLVGLAPEMQIPRIDEVRLDGLAVAFTMGLSVLTGIVFGLAPAMQATRRALRASLAERQGRLRGVLVIAEVALALVLLTSAGLLVKSVWQLQAVDPGFRPENVLAVSVALPDAGYPTAARMREFHSSALERLGALPGAATVGLVNWLPLGQMLIQGDFKVDGGERLPARYVVDKPVVSPGYFGAMGIRILRGRDFTSEDREGKPLAGIVSESVARTLWPGRDAIGRRISMRSHPGPEDWMTIVGVVGDVRQGGLPANPSPAVYQPYLQVNQPFFLSQVTYLLRTPGDAGALAGGVRAALREMDPNQPAQSIATMQDIIAGTTAAHRLRAELLAAFSLAALLLSAIGIYGVLAYAVVERRREIGIRMALGARAGSVVGMVVRRTLVLAGVGIGIGLAGSVGAARLLERYLFAVKSTDPATFLAVAGLLLLVALLAAAVPARRASTVDPVVALRHE